MSIWVDERPGRAALCLIAALCCLIGVSAFADDDEIHPIGEHDHFLGRVRVLGTGNKIYPNAGDGKNVFEVNFTSAKDGVQKFVAAPAQGHESVQVFPLKKSPNVSWYMQCPRADLRCGCRNGHSYRGFYIHSDDAKEQGFTFDIATARLDVNDMKITRQDGTTYLAPGVYKIEMETTINKHATSCTLVGNASTKTGLDVARGFKYTVTTQAESEEGSTLTSTQEVDLR